MLSDATTIFREQLSVGERVLWSGQPKQGLLLRPSDVFLIPFSLLWGGFAIVGEVAAIVGGDICFALWGAPFALVGLYLLIGRFFVDAKKREKTYYAITNERAIILSSLFRRNIRTLSLKMLSDINVSVRNDGSGTITLGSQHRMASWYSGLNWPGSNNYMAPAFEMIDNVNQAHELLRKAQTEL